MPRRIAIGFLLVFAVSCTGCGYVDAIRRGRQASTQGSLQGISAYVRQAVEGGEGVTDEVLRRAIEESGRATDAWGNPFRYVTRRESDYTSWIVLSFGSDGRCDLADFRQYFDAEPERVDGWFRRDLVFRGGEPLTNAGK